MASLSSGSFVLYRAFLAFFAVSRLKPWDTLRAVAGRVFSGMLEARTFWIFMMGVAVGAIVIPLLMVRLRVDS